MRRRSRVIQQLTHRFPVKNTVSFISFKINNSMIMWKFPKTNKKGKKLNPKRNSWWIFQKLIFVKWAVSLISIWKIKWITLWYFQKELLRCILSRETWTSILILILGYLLKIIWLKRMKHISKKQHQQMRKMRM
jgi:hypothetical protein